MPSRREFIEGAAVAAAGFAFPAAGASLPSHAAAPPASAASPPAGFLDLIRPPDRIVAQTSAGDVVLANGPAERWTSDRGVTATTVARGGALRVTLASPSAAITRHNRLQKYLFAALWFVSERM